MERVEGCIYIEFEERKRRYELAMNKRERDREDCLVRERER